MADIKWYIEIKCNDYCPQHLDMCTLSPDSNSRPQNTQKCFQSGRSAQHSWMSSLFFSLSPQNSQSHSPSNSTCIEHKLNKSISTPTIQCSVLSPGPRPGCLQYLHFTVDGLDWTGWCPGRRGNGPCPCSEPAAARHIPEDTCNATVNGWKLKFLIGTFVYFKNFQIRLICLLWYSISNIKIYITEYRK